MQEDVVNCLKSFATAFCESNDEKEDEFDIFGKIIVVYNAI